MLHVANHGTHHRGELAAMLALLNAPHPEDDLLDYFIEGR
ncbi:MAG: DinB family protein [Anaerolineales bacterium]